MKKNTILILALFFSIFFASAQEKVKHKCSSDNIHLKLMKEDDSYKEKFERNNHAWSKFINKRDSYNNKNGQSLLNTQTTLTVVFHDVKNDPATPYLIDNTGSYQYIVDKLNLIYDGTNLGGKPQTNDTQIQFCLALQDKNVNPYFGSFTYHTTSLGSIDKDNLAHIDQIVANSGATSKFPTKNYINIYIVDEIIGNVTGFAFLPSAHGKSYDGIFIEREYLVNNPLLLDNNMNVLAHEMGHYLGLFHVFGICDPATILTFPQCSCDNSNPIFNGDMVADTQPMELNFDCSPAPTSCGSTIPDDKSNYMDYGDFSCQNKFTPGQIDRMHFMIDSEFGARNSLLETKSCDICTGLFNCNFTIQIPNTIIANKVVVNTPLNFNVNTNCSSNPAITYSWELLHLDTNTVVSTGSMLTFNQTITAVGNYKLMLKASLTSNSNCVEEANPFKFKVFPEQGNSGPGSGTDYCKTLPDLNFTNFERVQYKKGWSLGPGSSLTNYTWPSTERYVDTDAGFEPNSFEIIDPSTFSDVNFPSATVLFGVNKILRVGKVINQTNVLPDGAAYYVKVKFKPTPDNCKFLVHYLGMKQVTTTPESASLGILVQLSYESPLNPGYIKHIGQSEWGNKWEGTSNLGATTSLYNEFNKISSNGDFTSSNIIYGLKDYKTTVQWKSKLLDFSEFAILNQGTNQNFEVTLTFFVRSNDQSAGTQQAYAYYGIQCLGGGLPDNFDFSVSNYDLPCQFPEDSQECVYQNIIYPRYFPASSQAYYILNSNNYAFGNYTREYSDDDVTYYPYSSSLLNKFCKGNNSYPYRYFKITYTTFTQTIVKKFRITNQFFHNEPPCSPAVDIGGVNNSNPNLDTYFCAGNANFTTGISFTNPCFSALTQPGGLYTYRWLINGTVEVDLGTDAVINYTALNTYLNSLLKQNICNFDLRREVQYIDPYCGSKAWYATNSLRLYNVIGQNPPSSLVIQGLNDFCMNDNLTFTIKNFKLQTTCLIPPSPPYSAINNHMVIQLITSNGSTLIGDPQTIPLTNLNSIFDINFDIPNDNGNGTYLFMPGTYGLNLSITLNLYGCTKTIILNNTVTHINFDVSPIALAGEIELTSGCDIEDINIVSLNDGITNLNYTWEFSTDGGVTFSPISTAPAFPYLNDVSSYFTTFPVTIRRKSNEFPLCSNPAYTNTVFIDTPIVPYIEFDLPENLCVGADPFTLPLISSTQITGTWNTEEVLTSTPGIYTYTFTPDPNQCIVDPYTYELTILENCNVFISWNADVGCQVSENDHDNDGVQEDVNIEDGDCIKVCENSVIIYTLTGNTSLIDNTEWFVTGGTVISYSDTHCEIQWNAGAESYALQGTIYMSDLTIMYINKCIEKVNAPTALIGLLPNLEQEEVTQCVKSPINFQNLSTNNGGNENIYYQWDFGDGTFSTEFEPSHTYSTPGTYTVTLTATNGCSCVGVDEITVIVVNESIDISCPSVACEGQMSTYTISDDLKNNGCPIQWTVIGGQIVGPDSGVTSIDVIWDHIDEDGFGYVFVQSDECVQCVSSVKIPVVKNIGNIIGEISICPRTQHLYTLPQWPTTEFNWTLDDNGTGATLVVSNQRNEIFINSENPGTITLSCQYYNTLLDCGGNTSVTINVNSELNILGSQIACVNNEESYEITFDADPPVNFSYTIDGPNGFSYTDNAPIFDITYPEPGTYTFSVTADNYCYLGYFEVKVGVAEQPSADYLNPNPVYVCAGNPTNFFATTILPMGTIHWSTNHGTILGSSIGNHITVVFDPQPSYYQITLWTEHEGCTSEPVIWEFYNEFIDTQIQSNDSNVCGSSMGNYTTNETESEIYIWSIQPPEAGSVVNGQNTDQVEILWNQEAMPANVRLTMRKCGNDYIANFPVTITPTPVLTIAPTNTPVCTGAPGASFNLTLDPVTSYSSSSWDFGDNTGLIIFPAGSPITHVYNDPLLNSTVYNVTATVEGVDNCMFNATATTQITIAPSPIIAVTPNRNYSLCDGIFPGFMNYSVTLQNGAFATSTVEWYYNGTMVSDDTPTINASMPGNYYAIVTNLDGCSSTTQTYHTIDCNPDPGCVTPPLIVTNQTNTSCQQIEINITDPGAATGFTWGNLIGANANVVTATNLQYIATNISPGLYQMPIYPTYDPSTGYCEIPFYREFIIPYSADLKFNVQCNSGSYTINLLDYSQYYVETPIQTFEFTTDGGANWTTASNVATFSTTLAPGSYQLGIRIDRSDYPSCTSDFIPLELPEFPDADFAIPTSVCLNTAMQFIAPATTDPDLIYTWTFSDGSTNVQDSPVKTYSSQGLYQVTLTVTNRFGCTSTVSKNVEVIGQSYDIGFLNIDFENTCVGEDLIISYDAGFGNTLPYSYIWYHNEITDPPFAVTTNSDNDIIVDQPGQYFVYVADANGCLTYTTGAISASFIPTPAQPLVTGTGTICKGSTSSVKVPVDPSVTYKWWLNGVPQTAWDNDNSVGMIHNTVGTYIYEVVAEIEAESGSFCSSTAATFTVHVIEKPDVPTIGFDFDSCSPYHVNVFVTNPQVGIDYHWSNGGSGVSTEMIHDGPIRVTAKSSSCDVSAQIDLPLDLYMHTWYYPRGCYSLCELERNDKSYIIGPLVAFNHWIWYQDSAYYTGGSGQVDPLTSLDQGTYQLYLETDYHCDITLADISINKKECRPCEIDFQISEVTPRSNNEGCFYELSIYIGNPSGTTQVNLGSVGMDGYFVPSAFVVPNGGSFYTVNFYPLNGYTGGNSLLSITATVDNETCYSEIEFDLPPLCAGVDKQINASTQSLITKELKLVAAPNPTAGHTSVFFNFVETKGNKQIEVTDMYGRTLQMIKIDDISGTVNLDCSSYEAGQYFILMKQENQILKNCKLIIK